MKYGESKTDIPDNIILTNEAFSTEIKFFKLMTILIKNSEENMKLLRSIGKSLNEYFPQVILMYLAEYEESNNVRMKELYLEIKELIKSLLKFMD